MCSILCAVLFPATCTLSASAATPSSFSADLTVQLDKKSFLEDEPISGVIRFKLRAPASWPVSEKPTVAMHGPSVTVDPDANLPAIPMDTHLDSQIANPVKIGNLYEIRFKIAGADGFLTNVPRSVRSTPMFALGQHRLSVRIASPEWKSPWNSPPGGLRADWTGIFDSEPQMFAVSSADCSPLKHSEILAAIESSHNTHKESFTRFFHTRGQIFTPDLPRIIAKSEGSAKGSLVELYKSSGGPLKDLMFFQHPEGSVTLDDHTNAPFFLRLAPKEVVRFVYAGPATVNHNVNGLEQNYTTLAKPEKVTRAPAQLGLYRMVCDIHSSPWGWVLVTDAKGGPSDTGTPPSKSR